MFTAETRRRREKMLGFHFAVGEVKNKTLRLRVSAVNQFFILLKYVSQKNGAALW
jgi:hypothetical protein